MILFKFGFSRFYFSLILNQKESKITFWICKERGIFKNKLSKFWLKPCQLFEIEAAKYCLIFQYQIKVIQKDYFLSILDSIRYLPGGELENDYYTIKCFNSGQLTKFCLENLDILGIWATLSCPQAQIYWTVYLLKSLRKN